MSDDRVHAIVKTLHVHSNHTVEVFFGCALDRADMRDAGVVNKDVNAVVAEQFFKAGL